MTAPMTATALNWHNPRLDPAACAAGTMTDRERLGLPDRYVMTDLQGAVIAAAAALVGTAPPALQAMLERPDRAWTVESLARRCNRSRASFAREFRQRAGTGPMELLTTLRMEQAAQLLARGGRDTGSVGEAVGYRSEAAFNRAFGRYAGVTPGRYRRQTSEPASP